MAELGFEPGSHMNQPANGRAKKRGRKGGTRIIVARGENIRTYRLNPWLFGTGVGILLLFLTAYVGSTVYLIFRDDVLISSKPNPSKVRSLRCLNVRMDCAVNRSFSTT